MLYINYFPIFIFFNKIHGVWKTQFTLSLCTQYHLSHLCQQFAAGIFTPGPVYTVRSSQLVPVRQPCSNSAWRMAEQKPSLKQALSIQYNSSLKRLCFCVKSIHLFGLFTTKQSHYVKCSIIFTSLNWFLNSYSTKFIAGPNNILSQVCSLPP